MGARVMSYEYKFANSVFIMMFLFLAAFIFMIPIYLKEQRMFFLIIDLVIVLGGIFYMIPYLFSMTNIIDNEGVKEIETYYGKSKTKELCWDEIGYIVDDYISLILFYPPYKVHIFHVMPKDNIRKPFKRISISPGIKDYKDFLLKVVTKAGLDVKIDDYIYEFLEKYKKSLEENDRKR